MSWNTGLAGIALEIAQSDDKYLRVMAGPGTGKSFAMKRKVARLLEEQADPHRILAVTFTRTAAASLIRDLHDLGVQGCENIRSGTLHSFCFSILSRAEVLAYSGRVPRPIVTFGKSGVMQFEAAPMLQDLNHQEVFGTKRDRTQRIRAFEAAWARLQSDQPGWALTPVDMQFQEELVAWLRFHQAMLIGELVPETLQYIRNNPVCEERTAFDHVIVDEYQDLNRAEQVLLDLVSSDGSLAVVGDEDQSIYRFRHAHPEGIAQFAETHEGTQDKNLVVCRRCPQRIVRIADHFIQYNHPGNQETRLNPMPDKPEGEVHIIQWESLDQEVSELAEYVEHLIADRNYGPGDVLVLCPRRLIGYGIRDALVARGIPTHSFYHEEALEDERAQRSFTLLTMLVSQEDRVALRFWLGYGSPSWREGQYRILREYCEQGGLSPWYALEQLNGGVVQLNRTGDLLARFRELLSELQLLHPLAGTALIDRLFPPDQPWATPIREILLPGVAEEIDAATLLEHLRTVVTQPEIPESSDFVRVMSLHKSKGLTSKIVIVAGCIQGLIPAIGDDESPAEQQASLREHRRLFYVAVTRATDILVLSSAVRLDRALAHRLGAVLHMGGGQVGRTIASEFIAQLGPDAPVPISGAQWHDNGYV